MPQQNRRREIKDVVLINRGRKEKWRAGRRSDTENIEAKKQKFNARISPFEEGAPFAAHDRTFFIFSRKRAKWLVFREYSQRHQTRRASFKIVGARIMGQEKGLQAAFCSYNQQRRGPENNKIQSIEALELSRGEWRS